MKTLLTLFVLFFSSSVVAEFPTKLFGVELYDDIKNYSEDQKSYYDKDDSFFDWRHIGELENMESNPYFEIYEFFQDENDRIVSIAGWSDYKGKHEHLSICFDEVDLFANFLKSYYSIKKEFETNLYSASFFNENTLVNKSNVYERRTFSKINGKKSILSISCVVPSNTRDNYPGNVIILALKNESFEQKFINTDLEGRSSKYEYYNYNEFIRSFKKLGFDDFNGF